MRKGKRDRYCPPFVALSKELILRTPEWWALSHGARDIYLLLKAKHNGSNNGRICLYYAEVLNKRIAGLRSPKAISAAFRELEDNKWIKRTKIGGLYRFKNEYALLWTYDTQFTSRS